MVGRNRQERLDRLISDVAQGRRTLSSIRDEELREAVRVALRLHRETPSAPDAYARMRMRARVLAGLQPRHNGLRDIAWAALELVGRPAPYLVRGIALGSVLITAGLGMTVASADTLPDDLLYPVKLASEQVRLMLATASDDHAMVELSIAEHRLGEAERLAMYGRTADALIASAVYSQHIASAAADLAPTATASLAQQLEESFTAQRSRAQSLATSLGGRTTSARAAAVLALIAAPAVAPGADPVERVVRTAADVASHLASAAEDTLSATPAPVAAPSPRSAAVQTAAAPIVETGATQPPVESDGRSAMPGSIADARAAVAASGTPRTEKTRAAAPAVEHASTSAPTASAPATPDRDASEAARVTRRAADAAQAAVERVRRWMDDTRRANADRTGHGNGRERGDRDAGDD